MYTGKVKIRHHLPNGADVLRRGVTAASHQGGSPLQKSLHLLRHLLGRKQVVKILPCPWAHDDGYLGIGCNLLDVMVQLFRSVAAGKSKCRRTQLLADNQGGNQIAAHAGLAVLFHIQGDHHRQTGLPASQNCRPALRQGGHRVCNQQVHPAALQGKRLMRIDVHQFKERRFTKRLCQQLQRTVKRRISYILISFHPISVH